MLKIVKTPLSEEMTVTLESIEFENDYEGDEVRPHRTVFQFRLYPNVDEDHIYYQCPVTMCEPYDGLEDLRVKAWRELYIMLRQFAEWARRESDAPELAFEDASE